MDLFVINRHQETEFEENEVLNKNEKMQQVLKKIERNKKIRAKQKESKKLNTEEKLRAIQKTTENRKRRRCQRQIHEAVVNSQKELCEPKEVIERVDDIEQGKVSLEEPKNKKEKGSNDVSEIAGFTILGDTEFQKKSKIKRVLPKWLAEPTVISTNLQNLQIKTSSMSELNKKLRRKLKTKGIHFFFPVQAVVIPWLLKEIRNSSIIFPRDICVSAPTGSGKTLAFVLPIIHHLMTYKVKKIRALVILPTQDLALQVYETFKLYSVCTNIYIGLITGKKKFTVEQKQLIEEIEPFGYKTKVDILVCTAGRLVDHLKDTKGLDLKCIEFLVIDEADRVLDSVQNDWLYHLEKHLQSDDDGCHSAKVLNLLTLRGKRPPQKLLFSATLSQDPEKLQKLSLFQPKLFTSVVEKSEAEEKPDEGHSTSTFLGKYTTPNELTEKYIVCSLDLKPLVLYQFIVQENLTKALVFTNSAESAHRLVILLNSMFKGQKKVEEMPLKIDINKKNELTKSFINGVFDILVCTDRLARGIDLPGTECVISYGAPKFIKTYIHRVGRTARAGRSGLAVTLLQENQLSKFKAALSQAEKNNLEEVVINEEKLEELADQYKQALGELKDSVLEEETAELKKMKRKKRPKKMQLQTSAKSK
ncbi:probable ATP-dependent RNA helicase Dbp73D [Agrilus planipennis]|uniref:ATP-dependent RNA helicase n=1 Tax=Agrilus planipennis TaxID=224129 RepID=A0A7F5RG27_AGRPL|nr:probable ATP-dependent RNA helicase Dbp73D [Agrilus planipennis]